MQLTTKAHLALTALIELAMHPERGPVPLCEVSKRQQISQSYLEQLFGKLRRRELVVSTRGPGGGYALGRCAGDISVADIVAAVDAPSGDTASGDATITADKDGYRCATPDVWAGLEACMLEYLATVSLEELVEQQKSRSASTGELTIKRAPAFASLSKPEKVAQNRQPAGAR